MKECPILLVDDDPDDIAIMMRAIKKSKIENRVYAEGGGEQALNFLWRGKESKDVPVPGLILLDLKMPRVNGFDVLKQIKQDAELKSIPVIMFTSSESDKDIRKAYQLGCNNYITKPSTFKNLVEIVTILCDYWLIVSRIPWNGRWKNR